MGVLTLSMLRGWDPLALATAGQQVATTSASVDDGLRAITTAMDDVADGWSGLGHDAATTHTGRVTTAGNRTSTALVGLADLLTSAATDLAAVRGTPSTWSRPPGRRASSYSTTAAPKHRRSRPRSSPCKRSTTSKAG